MIQVIRFYARALAWWCSPQAPDQHFNKNQHHQRVCDRLRSWTWCREGRIWSCESRLSSASDFFFLLFFFWLILTFRCIDIVFRIHGRSFQGGSGSCLRIRILGALPVKVSAWYAVHTHDINIAQQFFLDVYIKCIFGPRYCKYL